MPVKITVEAKFSPEYLKNFREKAEFMAPICFGGYNPDDPVCSNWCPRATYKQMSAKFGTIREKLDEWESDLFTNDLGCSCQEQRRKLADNLGKAQKALAMVEEAKRIRNQYYLIEGSKGVKRIPVGGIKHIFETFDFVAAGDFILETRGENGFSRRCPVDYVHACAALHQSGKEISHPAKGYIKKTRPKLPIEATIPVVITEQERDDKFIILKAIAKEAAGNKNMPYSYYIAKGEEVILYVYERSAVMDLKMDELGRLE